MSSVQRSCLLSTLFLWAWALDLAASTPNDRALFRLHEGHGREGGLLRSVHWRLREIERIGGIDDRFQELARGLAPSLEVDWNTILGKLISVEAFAQFDGDNCLTFSAQEFDLRDYTGDLLLREIIDAGGTTILAHLDGRPPSPYRGQFRDHIPVAAPVDFMLYAHFGLAGSIHNIGGHYHSFRWNIQELLDTEGLHDEKITPTEKLTHTFFKPGLFSVKAQGILEAPVLRRPVGIEATTEFFVGRCEPHKALEIVLDSEQWDSSSRADILGPIPATPMGFCAAPGPRHLGPPHYGRRPAENLPLPQKSDPDTRRGNSH